jgi:hypothetical protein
MQIRLELSTKKPRKKYPTRIMTTKGYFSQKEFLLKKKGECVTYCIATGLIDEIINCYQHKINTLLSLAMTV